MSWILSFLLSRKGKKNINIYHTLSLKCHRDCTTTKIINVWYLNTKSYAWKFGARGSTEGDSDNLELYIRTIVVTCQFGD